MYERLFTKGQIGSIQLKNRLIMSSMGTGLARADGSPSEEMLSFYEARARGGAGLIIPEITCINEYHGMTLRRQLSIAKEGNIRGLAKLSDVIHKHGSKIFIQLHHPGRETYASLIDGLCPVAPSDVTCKYTGEKTRTLETYEVIELIEQFVNGAARVQKSGCDGVELHAAHGYLINQFLSPYTNKRTDEYGGSFENRMRFLIEIIEGIKAVCGSDYPIGVRLTVDELLDQTGVTENYIRLQDGIRMAKVLERAGVSYINVSCGIYESGNPVLEPISFAQGWKSYIMKAIKDNVGIPITGLSAIREPAVAENLLENGTVDFISMGRAWLADESWGLKVMEGHEKQLRKCISCLHCYECLQEKNLAKGPVTCTVNPGLAETDRKKNKVKPGTVVIVGGGPSGLSAAETFGLRGMKIILLEKQNRLGGTLNLGMEPPGKGKLRWVAEYYEETFRNLDITVKLGVKADIGIVMSYNPDAVVIATGSKPNIGDGIIGSYKKHVYGIETILRGEAYLTNQNIIVIGAGASGLLTADYLSERGNQVTVIDKKFAPNINTDPINYIELMKQLKYKVKFMFGYNLIEIQEDAALLEFLGDGSITWVNADAIVLSMGSKPNHALFDQLKKRGVPVSVIGSAVKEGNIAPAIRMGYEVGSSLLA